ncbi:MAG TPA: DUF5657 family protein [Candidatus Eisenbacteria bacterium]|nr:DUF5657 family protein [Candidatus Eisenbacteria bacterium]
MNPEQLLQLQTQGGIFIFKIGFLIILGMVGLFLFVIRNQIRSMNTIVTQPDMFPYLEAFVYFLFICVIALFIVTAVIL